eukprot:TRINITY_DN61_c0_g1_i10.p2 TRINITY_DN61_c0_g1~~TRINITY_DN61_c0_g1_i10.p2  ORF type:complete len:121 (+),score=43.97 TRINITY_DN61_c0_g1_i10:119-481(+)
MGSLRKRLSGLDSRVRFMRYWVVAASHSAHTVDGWTPDPRVFWCWRMQSPVVTMVAPAMCENLAAGPNDMDDSSVPPYSALICLLYTSDAADEEDSVDLGGRRIIKKKKKKKIKKKKKKE